MNKESGSTIVIRDVETGAELRAVEQLQKETWGVSDLDVVPLTQLIAAKTAGGALLGAFDGDEMVGFVYGFGGVEDGKPAHHSHMLAVRPDYRNHDLGRRLKFAQRERVLELGVELMTWTFDPLQSLNAHFNFNKLGVVSDRYLVDFYGRDATSFLHRNGTDRLWVSWFLNSERVKEMAAGEVVKATFPEAVPLVELGEDDRPRSVGTEESLPAERFFIEIPVNIGELEARDFGIAAEWRKATRKAFLEAIGAGYRVADYFLRTDGGRKRGAYLLDRRKQ